MKPISILVLFFMAVQLRAAESPGAAQARETSPVTTTTRLDANSRRVECTTNERNAPGELVNRKNQFVEISSGLYYQDSISGEWLESKEEIEILPNGTAQATRGQHQVFFTTRLHIGRL